jgi:hypothetical protein
MNEAAFLASPTPTYGIVGSGRVAKHLQHYLQLSEIPCLRWSRSENKHLFSSLLEADVILLAISDSAIEEFYSAHPALELKPCLHFSGSLVSPKIPSAHPLFTFSHLLYDLEVYRSIPFICEAGRQSFKDFFPQLPNPSYQIPAEAKARYHALCVLSGNFTQMLWQKFFRELAKMELPVEVALPYLKQNLENLLTDPLRSLTGPFVRGDQATIDRNLNALEGDAFQAVYQAFWEAYKNEHS